jgi:DtxR family transcriptional regulator, Mn-dependent transcriptional regulator
MRAVSEEHDHAPALSHAAQSYLLTLRAMSGGSEPLRAASLSRRLGVSGQAASEMIGRLAADGLVVVGNRHELSLSDAGRAEADSIFRRHALLEWLLSGVIGLGWAESDEEAARLQGALSPRVEEKLAALLGNPPTCPHGNPIDSAAARARPAGIPLSKAESGTEVTILRITEEAEEDAELLAYLEDRRLIPGASARIVEVSAARDSMTVEGPAGPATLGLRPAGMVRVLAGKADPELFHRIPDQVSRPAPRG